MLCNKQKHKYSDNKKLSLIKINLFIQSEICLNFLWTLFKVLFVLRCISVSIRNISLSKIVIGKIFFQHFYTGIGIFSLKNPKLKNSDSVDICGQINNNDFYDEH